VGFDWGRGRKEHRSYPNDRRKQKQELAVAHLTMLIERDAMLIQLVWVAVLLWSMRRRSHAITSSQA